jgi:hypothetical protein
MGRDNKEKYKLEKEALGWEVQNLDFPLGSRKPRIGQFLSVHNICVES